MAKRILFLPLLLLLATNILFAQQIDVFLGYLESAPFEKLYLHTDREFYFSGDTLWFAAYLVEGDSHVPVAESCNLYVDLTDAKGEIIKNELFMLQNGLGQGWLSLSDSVKLEGNYLLRAYTDYLKNFGNDAFFTKTVRISTIKNSFDLQLLRDIPSVSRKIDISFLPEGGFLLAQTPNCVAFKVVDETGKGIPVSGQLLDEKNKPVLTFKTTYKGAGKFYFYPEEGENYTARIDGFAGFKYKLPAVKETGAKIMLVNQDKNKLQLVIQGKNVNRNFPFYLVCMHRGKGLFSLEINRRRLNEILKIDASKLKSGINRLVLLDKSLTPVSERLVFKDDIETNKLQVRLSEDAFSTRANVQLNIKDTTTSEISFLSVAVVDENYVNATGVSQNIASYLLLDSELKGIIESPADYFVSDDSIDCHTKLDLLMAVNGWSNYTWNNLQKDSLNLEYQPQLGLNFEGHLKRAIGNKALPKGSVSMLFLKAIVQPGLSTSHSMKRVISGLTIFSLPTLPRFCFRPGINETKIQFSLNLTHRRRPFFRLTATR